MTNDETRTWLFLFSVMTAAMVFVKNEAMLLFLPPLALLFFILCEWWKCRKDFWIWMMTVAVVAVPWTLFKFAHSLTFGNATEVSSFSFAPNPAVLPAILGDLLYTGSYLLFFPLFLLLLFLGWHFWKRHVLGLLILFLLVVFFGEIGIYWLTPLSVEAIRHTGFGRGMVHLLPLGVFVAIILLQGLLRERKNSCSCIADMTIDTQANFQ